MDVGLKKLALAVVAAAVNDRNAAIRYLSRVKSRQVHEVYSAALKRRQSRIEKQGAGKIDKDALLAQAQKLIKGKREEAESVIRETTEFLLSESTWHQIVGIHPDAMRRRLEKSDIDVASAIAPKKRRSRALQTA